MDISGQFWTGLVGHSEPGEEGAGSFAERSEAAAHQKLVAPTQVEGAALTYPHTWAHAPHVPAHDGRHDVGPVDSQAASGGQYKHIVHGTLPKAEAKLVVEVEASNCLWFARFSKNKPPCYNLIVATTLTIDDLNCDGVVAGFVGRKLRNTQGQERRTHHYETGVYRPGL